MLSCKHIPYNYIMMLCYCGPNRDEPGSTEVICILVLSRVTFGYLSNCVIVSFYVTQGSIVSETWDASTVSETLDGRVRYVRRLYTGLIP